MPVSFGILHVKMFLVFRNLPAAVFTHSIVRHTDKDCYPAAHFNDGPQREFGSPGTLKTFQRAVINAHVAAAMPTREYAGLKLGAGGSNHLIYLRRECDDTQGDSLEYSLSP